MGYVARTGLTRKKTQMFWDEIWKRKIHFVKRMGRVDDNINMDLTEIYGENVV